MGNYGYLWRSLEILYVPQRACSGGQGSAEGNMRPITPTHARRLSRFGCAVPASIHFSLSPVVFCLTPRGRLPCGRAPNHNRRHLGHAGLLWLLLLLTVYLSRSARRGLLIHTCILQIHPNRHVSSEEKEVCSSLEQQQQQHSARMVSARKTSPPAVSLNDRAQRLELMLMSFSCPQVCTLVGFSDVF